MYRNFVELYGVVAVAVDFTARGMRRRTGVLVPTECDPDFSRALGRRARYAVGTQEGEREEGRRLGAQRERTQRDRLLHAGRDGRSWQHPEKVACDGGEGVDCRSIVTHHCARVAVGEQRSTGQPLVSTASRMAQAKMMPQFMCANVGLGSDACSLKPHPATRIPLGPLANGIVHPVRWCLQEPNVADSKHTISTATTRGSRLLRLIVDDCVNVAHACGAQTGRGELGDLKPTILAVIVRKRLTAKMCRQHTRAIPVEAKLAVRREFVDLAHERRLLSCPQLSRRASVTRIGGHVTVHFNEDGQNADPHHALEVSATGGIDGCEGACCRARCRARWYARCCQSESLPASTEDRVGLLLPTRRADEFQFHVIVKRN